MCDWPIAAGGTCSFEGRRRPSFGLELCGIHVTMVTRAVVRDICRDPFGERGGEGSGREILAAMWHYAARHPDSEIWEWVRQMEEARLMVQVSREPRPEMTVYFAERDGFVKIGTSGNVTRRLVELAAGGQMPDGMTAGPLRLLRTVPGGHAVEREFHRRFEHLRIDPRREWFLLDGDLERYIAGKVA